MNRLTPEKILEACTRYQNGESSGVLAKHYGVSSTAIRGLLRRRGIARRTQSEAQRKYALNENVFRSIDNEQSAYWLGFIAADGCITRDGVKITLAEKDAEHLKQLAQFFATDKPILISAREVAPYATLDICSPVVRRDLANAGITPRKTFTVTFPILLPHLIRHFIRGYIDGDGSFSLRPARPGNATFTVTSNLTMLESIQSVLIKECEVNKVKFTQRHIESPIYTLVYCGGKQVRRIHQYLYNDCEIALERKRVIF